MEPMWMIGIVLGMIVVLILYRFSFKPLKWVGQGIVKILIGAMLLFFLNAFGNNFGIHVPINLITASISGFLGIPGVIALAVLQIYIV